jgi:hypothetical protein
MPDQAEPDCVIVLTEVALTLSDITGLLGVYHTEGQTPRFRVLVPAVPTRSLLADVLDHLSLFEMGKAVEAVAHPQAHERAHEDRAVAERALSLSLERLRDAGAQATGLVADGNPVQAVAAQLAQEPARELAVVTLPHAVEDTLRSDWASRARHHLGLPVLHLYSGSDMLG